MILNHFLMHLQTRDLSSNKTEIKICHLNLFSKMNVLFRPCGYSQGFFCVPVCRINIELFLRRTLQLQQLYWSCCIKALTFFSYINHMFGDWKSFLQKWNLQYQKNKNHKTKQNEKHLFSIRSNNRFIFRSKY